MKYKFIPYDKKLVTKARELRASQTTTEKFFWAEILKSSELKNFTFLRQKPLGHFIADFYCASTRIAIEIDGSMHDSSRDKERDNYLQQSFGIKVIRYKNSDILTDVEKVKANFLKQFFLQVKSP